MKWATLLLLTFRIFVILLGAWLMRIICITKANYQAYPISTSEHQGNKNPSASLNFQEILNKYFRQHEK